MLELFLTFLKVGAVSFGGGYGMLSLLREEVLAHAWMDEAQFMNFIAVSESTPGPIAVNMATFIGSTQGGVIGSLLATLGVVLPAFLIILLISAVLKNLLKYAGVEAALNGIRPAVVGLIIATAVSMFLTVVIGIKNIDSEFCFDWKSLVILAVILGVKKAVKKKISPIVLICISAMLGIILYGMVE